jgi:hypothetical protein
MAQRSRDEYVRIGETLNTADVLAQLDHSVALLRRDSAVLTEAGLDPGFADLLLELRRKIEEHLREAATKGAPREELTDAVRAAKAWRLRAIECGLKATTGERAAQLLMLSVPTHGDPDRLADTVAEVLRLARSAEAEFRRCGADDAFYLEGEESLVGMRAALEHRGKVDALLRRSADDPDELDGRAWEKLKELHERGRAAFEKLGDEAHAGEYDLDILYRHAEERGEV